MIVKIFAVRTVKDTQCGFKLFSRSAAARVMNGFGLASMLQGCRRNLFHFVKHDCF